jgi:hypothetical protein
MYNSYPNRLREYTRINMLKENTTVYQTIHAKVNELSFTVRNAK